jgi:hypothetical protein
MFAITPALKSLKLNFNTSPSFRGRSVNLGFGQEPVRGLKIWIDLYMMLRGLGTDLFIQVTNFG